MSTLEFLKRIEEIGCGGGDPEAGSLLPRNPSGSRKRSRTLPGCILSVVLAVVFLMLSSAPAANADEKINIALEVERESGTEQYAPLVAQVMDEAIGDLTQFQISEKKTARFLIAAKLVTAEESIVDNVPSADVSFLLRIYEINPETGKPGLGILVNSTVTKQSVGVSLEKAIREIVKGATTNALGMLRYRVGRPGLKRLYGQTASAQQTVVERKSAISYQ